MRVIPNMRVIVPADAISVRHLITAILHMPGPFYFRLARPSSEVLYAENGIEFKIGKGNILQDGTDVTIISCGLMVARSLEGAKILKKRENISCRIVDMFSIKPIDIELVDKCARDTGAVVTVEEHNILGGLGSAVSETSAEMYPVPIIRLGIRDKFGESARDEEIDTLLEKYGLSPAEIARTAIRVRSGTRR